MSMRNGMNVMVHFKPGELQNENDVLFKMTQAYWE